MGAQDSSRYYVLRWTLIVTLCQGRPHNYSTWWPSCRRCQRYPMTVAKMNNRLHGMEGLRRNTNEMELPGQLHRRLKGNWRRLTFEVRLDRGRSKKTEMGSDDARLIPNPPSRIERLCWIHWRSPKRKLQMADMHSRRRSSTVRKIMWPSHDVRRRGIWKTGSVEERT